MGFRTLVEKYLDGVCLVVEGKILYANRTLRDMTGLTAAEAIGQPISEFVVPEERDRARLRVRELFRGAPEYTSQYRIRHTDGHTLPVEVCSRLIEYEGKPALISVIRNISERERAGAALRMQLTAMDSATDGLAIVDESGSYTYMNPAYAQLYGYASPAELLGRSWSVMYDDVVADRIESEILPIVRRTGRWFGELAARTKSGRRIDTEVSLTSLEIGGMVCVCHDITERRRADAALRESEERYRALYEDNPSMYFTVDSNGTVLSVNKFGAEQLGYTAEELIGQPVLGVFHEDDKQAVVRQLQECLQDPDRVASWQFRKQRKNGSMLWVRERARTVQGADGPMVLIVCEDITELKRAEEERRKLDERVRHAQKLESLGVMAGGVAHDFNNLLVGILGNASLALAKLPPDASARRNIQGVEKTADRAAELCRQLLAYSGRGRFEVRPIDMSSLVGDLEDLISVAVSKKARVTYEIPARLPPVEGDATQLRQVVMNLVTNASEAIGEAAGRVEVATRAVEIDRDYENPFVGEVARGRYVCLEVGDTGCGMSGDTLSRIFDPFFTTKFTGRGLGLAAVLGIVRGHGGAIEVQSEPGRGTVFRTLFPCSETAIIDEEPTRPAASIGEGAGTVLVIDDEAIVRSVARQALEQAGFAVITAPDGAAGVDSFRQHAEEIRVVLLDMTMPGLSAEECFRILRGINDGVRIVLSSGYDETETTSRFAGYELGGFVQKPYRAAELVAKIREALE
jgi:PAS domain S-box-containing protein